MFVLRFSISVQVTKKMIGMIKEEGGEGVQISIGADEKLTSGGGTFIWHSRSINVISKTAHFLKHPNFQFYRAYPIGFIWKK